MLYATLLLGLIGLTQAQYEPITFTRSVHWRDYVNCNDDSWYFDSVIESVWSRHRDGTEDMTEGVCYRGEWSNSGTDNNGDGTRNLWAAAQFEVYEDDDVTPINTFDVTVLGRLYGYCDYEPADSLSLEIRYDWLDNGDCDMCGYDDNWNEGPYTLYDKTKNRNNCNGWSGQMTSSNTNWLSEVTCTDGSNGVSCYWDYEVTHHVTGGNRFELKWLANLDNGFSNEAWAFGDLHIDIEGMTTTNGASCCTGTRTDHPSKSCGAFHEIRNCEAKGCTWNSNCNTPCCRFADKTRLNKEKDTCKEVNDRDNWSSVAELTQKCANQNGGVCTMTVCDSIGLGDNTDGIPGNHD